MALLKKITSFLDKNKDYQTYSTSRLIKSIMSNEQEIVPLPKLIALAQLSYSTYPFEMLQIIETKIKSFEGEADDIKGMVNLMSAVNFLIKNGADEVYQNIKKWPMSHDLTISKQQYQKLLDHKDSKKLIYWLQEIKHKAKYIENLFKNQNDLRKQRKISQLVRKYELERKLTEQNNCEHTSNALKIGLSQIIGHNQDKDEQNIKNKNFRLPFFPKSNKIMNMIGKETRK